MSDFSNQAGADGGLTGLKPGVSLPDLEIVVLGSNNKPGNFILRPGMDDMPIGPVTVPGKSASIATELTLDTEIPQMFPSRLNKEFPIQRNETLSAAFVEDIRAAGFEVVFVPTPQNPRHVRIVPKTGDFSVESDRELLSIAFDQIAKSRKERKLNK